MNVLDVLDRLENVTGRCGKWTACCPAHEDKSPSLAITEAYDRVLIHCFAGCETADVMAAIGLSLADLFYNKLSDSALTEGRRRRYQEALITERLQVAIINSADTYHPKDIRVEKTGHAMLSDYLMRLGKETGRFLPITPKDAIKSEFFRIKEMQPLFASNAMFLKDSQYELESELLAFREHGTFKKDTLDALRWATEDIFPNRLQRGEKGIWETSMPKTLACDWETGEIYSA